MNVFLKVGGAVIGMAVLAALAYHQGRVDQAVGEEGSLLLGTAQAASGGMTPLEGNSPTRALAERDAYFPGTEGHEFDPGSFEFGVVVEGVD